MKVFDLAAARTGLREHEAKAAGFNPLTVETAAWDHKAYYPGAHEMRVRVTGDTDTGKLLGAQIVGHWRSEVAKRIDIFAAALFHGMSVEDFNDLDLSYTPPLSSPVGPGTDSRSGLVPHGVKSTAFRLFRDRQPLSQQLVPISIFSY